MEFDRRKFLGLLMAAAPAAVIPQSLWTPAPIPQLPPLQTGAVTDLAAIVRETMRQIYNQLGSAKFAYAPGVLGSGGLVHQFGVDLPTPEKIDDTGLSIEKYIAPIAAIMVDEIRKHGFTKMGQLPLPRGVDRAEVSYDRRSGLSVRGICFYDPDHGAQVLRIDMIGG